MSHIPNHHAHPQYVHYTGPPGAPIQTHINPQNLSIAPPPAHRQQQPTQLQQILHPQQQHAHQQYYQVHVHEPQHQQQHRDLPLQQHQQQQQMQQQLSQQQSNTEPEKNQTVSTPLVATGDWTKDLVHLAKTAELKKHALTLQLHTAHILSAHASLDEKNKSIQDVREQKNKLESERTRLLNCLRQINEDRDKAELMESTMDRECAELRQKITQLTDGEYAIAKRDVDRLRQELGQPPLPSVQTTLEEKSAAYLNQRRLDGNGTQESISTKPAPKRRAESDGAGDSNRKPRGRPRGSRNKKTTTT